MPRLGEFFRQLKQRRVIRTALVYAALVWGALQVADLLAEAELISANLVRWLILLGLAGFPVALVTSWFFETPWRGRKRISVLVDVAVILAVAIGIFLLGWQQYFKSFTRPTLAILRIEPTDTQPDTSAFAAFLAGRFRLVLAKRPELAVTELSSSLSSRLENHSIPQKARLLQADYLLTGTLNQDEEELRLHLQLYAASGALLWSDRYEDRWAHLAQLEIRALQDLWNELPLPVNEFSSAQSALFDCDFPADAQATRVMIRADSGLLGIEDAIDALSTLIGQHPNTGLLHLSRARVYYRQMSAAPPPRRPVLNGLANQELDRVSLLCPDHPEAVLLSLHNQARIFAGVVEIGAHLTEFPNDASAMLERARMTNDEDGSGDQEVYAHAAWLIDPLNTATVCEAQGLLIKSGRRGFLAEMLSHAEMAFPDDERICAD